MGASGRNKGMREGWGDILRLSLKLSVSSKPRACQTVFEEDTWGSNLGSWTLIGTLGFPSKNCKFPPKACQFPKSKNTGSVDRNLAEAGRHRPTFYSIQTVNTGIKFPSLRPQQLFWRILFFNDEKFQCSCVVLRLKILYNMIKKQTY